MAIDEVYCRTCGEAGHRDEYTAVKRTSEVGVDYFCPKHAPKRKDDRKSRRKGLPGKKDKHPGKHPPVVVPASFQTSGVSDVHRTKHGLREAVMECEVCGDVIADEAGPFVFCSDHAVCSVCGRHSWDMRMIKKGKAKYTDALSPWLDDVMYVDDLPRGIKGKARRKIGKPICPACCGYDLVEIPKPEEGLTCRYVDEFKAICGRPISALRGAKSFFCAEHEEHSTTCQHVDDDGTPCGKRLKRHEGPMWCDEHRKCLATKPDGEVCNRPLKKNQTYFCSRHIKRGYGKTLTGAESDRFWGATGGNKPSIAKVKAELVQLGKAKGGKVKMPRAIFAKEELVDMFSDEQHPLWMAASLEIRIRELMEKRVFLLMERDLGNIVPGQLEFVENRITDLQRRVAVLRSRAKASEHLIEQFKDAFKSLEHLWSAGIERTRRAPFVTTSSPSGVEVFSKCSCCGKRLPWNELVPKKSYRVTDRKKKEVLRGPAGSMLMELGKPVRARRRVIEMVCTKCFDPGPHDRSKEAKQIDPATEQQTYAALVHEALAVTKRKVGRCFGEILKLDPKNKEHRTLVVALADKRSKEVVEHRGCRVDVVYVTKASYRIDILMAVLGPKFADWEVKAALAGYTIKPDGLYEWETQAPIPSIRTPEQIAAYFDIEYPKVKERPSLVAASRERYLTCSKCGVVHLTNKQHAEQSDTQDLWKCPKCGKRAQWGRPRKPESEVERAVRFTHHFEGLYR
jgi:hypothetical protein